MKGIVLGMVTVLLLQSLCAQKVLSITTDQTSNLLFPSPVIHADRGTKDILVQLIKESDRVILVKAASRNFHATSMSVLTADGNLYSFLVKYDSLPSTLVYKIMPEKKADMGQYAKSILNRPSFLHGVRDKSWGVHTRVTGIYIRDSILFYQLSLENKSPLSYDIDQLRFYIRDKKKGKRTTVQETEIAPLYIAGNMAVVPANSAPKVVVAFQKFTIPDAKVFAIEIMERNGGRRLLMKMGNAKIVRAMPLADLND